MWTQIFMSAAGASSGCAVSIAALAFINALGIYPRMAIKSNTGKYLVFYENTAGAGLLAGCVFSLYKLSVSPMWWLLSLAGLCYGCFIGNLLMGLAEVIDVYPLLFKRIGLKTGLSVIILTAALGKFVGSLSYFVLQIWKQ